jgi:regulator of cell morphogenesis and NO signaling
MQPLAITDPVVDWAIDHPEMIPFFEKYGIDYCCAGKSLAYACEQRGVNPQQLLREFIESIGAKTTLQ